VSDIEQEFIKWAILRDSMTAISMASAMWILWKAFKKYRSDEFIAPFSMIGLVLASFVFSQNIHGIIKASVTPRIYIQTYWSIGGPDFNLRKELGEKADK
jgi:hypothetical protein